MMKSFLHHKNQFIIFLFIFFIYFFTRPGSTPYDYFVRLANSFLNFRLYLTENPSWLNELVPFNGKYYVIYPPMPAILSLPFVLFQGERADQTLISILIGSLNSVLIYSLTKKFLIFKFREKINKENLEKIAIWMGILFSLGTIHWYLASVGSAWYFAHISATFFLLLALNELFGKRRPFLIGFYLGGAYWSRLPTILSFLFFLIMIVNLEKERKLEKIFKFIFGVSIFVFLNFLYNYFRFGTIFDVAYYLRPNVLEEPWFKKGLFDLSYIPSHLKILFLQGPKVINHFPYFQPSWGGMAIWMTTPAFIFALIATFKKIKDKITLACWSAILPIAILVMSHGGTGFTQFGYRYAVDFYPFLLLLTISGMVKENGILKWYHKFFILIGVLVNFWGVICINKLGLVGW